MKNMLFVGPWDPDGHVSGSDLGQALSGKILVPRGAGPTPYGGPGPPIYGGPRAPLFPKKKKFAPQREFFFFCTGGPGPPKKSWAQGPIF